MKRILKLSFISIFLPMLTTAQGVWGHDLLLSTDNQAVNIGNNLLLVISIWVERLAILLIGVAVLVFFWGIVKYIASGADENERKAGRSFMVYGIIGIFVMVSVWGLVILISSFLGVPTGGGVDLPMVPMINADSS